MQEMHAMAELLTATRVGELLHLSRSTVTRMAADGRLPAVKVGRQWRFHPDVVGQLLAPARGPATLLQGERVDDAGDPAWSTAETRIPPDVAAALVEVAATSLGVMMVVTDMDGRPVTPVANPCPAFAAAADDPELVAACAAEWRRLADGLELTARFTTGRLGFQCARSFVRSGRELVGMVLAGGVAAPGDDGLGMHRIDDSGRRRVLEALPTLAATLAGLLPAPAATAPSPPPLVSPLTPAQRKTS